MYAVIQSLTIRGMSYSSNGKGEFDLFDISPGFITGRDCYRDDKRVRIRNGYEHLVADTRIDCGYVALVGLDEE